MFSRALIGSLVATIASVPRRGCPDPAGRARVSGCRARRSGACQRGCRPRRIGNRGVPGESGRMTRWHSFCADRIARFRFLVLYDMRGSFRGIALHPHRGMRSRRTIVCSAPCVRRRLRPPHAGPRPRAFASGCGQSPIRFPGVAVYSSRSCCSCLPAARSSPYGQPRQRQGLFGRASGPRARLPFGIHVPVAHDRQRRQERCKGAVD